MRYLIVGLVCLVVLAMVEYLTHSWILMWVLYLALIPIFLALRVTAKPVKLLAISHRLSREIVNAKQTVTVHVSVNWQAIPGPGWVMLEDQLPPAIETQHACSHLATLRGDHSSQFSYRITGNQRGFYPIGPLKITVGDYFGLVQVSASSQEMAYLTVLPRVVYLPKVSIPSNQPIGDAPSSKRIYEDATQNIDVREYAPGDTLSRIHWKTTARIGTLMTKIYMPSTVIEINLLLNLYEDDYPDEKVVDLACTTAASMVVHLVEEKHSVGLQSNGNDPCWNLTPKPVNHNIAFRPQKGEEQSSLLLATLGRLRTNEALPLAQYLLAIHHTLPWTATTVVITHCLSNESLIMLDSLLRRGYELAVIIVGEGERAEDSRYRAIAMRLPVAIIYSEIDLGQLEFWQPGS